jgi:hypothetical protein
LSNQLFNLTKQPVITKRNDIHKPNNDRAKNSYMLPHCSQKATA